MKTWQGVALAIALPTLMAGAWLINAPATKAVALADKATNTTKMLANYEWFHETSTGFYSRVSAIGAHKALIADEKDAGEVRTLKVELAGMKQMCRETAAKYTAMTNQIHVGYLKSKDLPETLNAQDCE